MTGPSELAAAAARRSVVYWFLAQLFLRCPGETFVAGLRQSLQPHPYQLGADEFAADLAGIAEALPADAAQTEELAVEYTRLFGAVNPAYGPPPPYESEHRDCPVAGEPAAAVSDFYATTGLWPGDQAAPPDHLGVELKFLAVLCHEEGQAWRTGDVASANHSLRQERSFLDEHLMTWAPAYLETVQANARHALYGRAAALTAGFITKDRLFAGEALGGAPAVLESN